MVKEGSVRLTANGKARLEAELETLRDERRPALAERIQQAGEEGDISDNSEYEDLKSEWAMIEARIRDLEQTLDRAEVIEAPPAGKVALGSKVTIRTEDGEEETWILVSPEEANTLDGTISTESPVGHALVGCRPGDSPTVTTPGGSMVYQVVSVE